MGEESIGHLQSAAQETPWLLDFFFLAWSYVLFKELILNVRALLGRVGSERAAGIKTSRRRPLGAA